MSASNQATITSASLNYAFTCTLCDKTQQGTAQLRKHHLKLGNVNFSGDCKYCTSKLFFTITLNGSLHVLPKAASFCWNCGSGTSLTKEDLKDKQWKCLGCGETNTINTKTVKE